MSRTTQDPARSVIGTCTGLSPSMVPLSRGFHLNNRAISQSYNPAQSENYAVWAISRSLATTREITIVFSSSGYLDVSVHRVGHRSLRTGCPIRKSSD